MLFRSCEPRQVLALALDVDLVAVSKPEFVARARQSTASSVGSVVVATVADEDDQRKRAMGRKAIMTDCNTFRALDLHGSRQRWQRRLRSTCAACAGPGPSAPKASPVSISAAASPDEKEPKARPELNCAARVHRPLLRQEARATKAAHWLALMLADCNEKFDREGTEFEIANAVGFANGIAGAAIRSLRPSMSPTWRKSAANWGLRSVASGEPRDRSHAADLAQTLRSASSPNHKA